MQYREFLRLSGATEDHLNMAAYQKYVEPAYMENDDLFPTKDEVVEHWHRFGLLGFVPDFVLAMRKAVDAMKHCHVREDSLRGRSESVAACGVWSQCGRKKRKQVTSFFDVTC